MAVFLGVLDAARSTMLTGNAIDGLLLSLCVTGAGLLMGLYKLKKWLESVVGVVAAALVPQ